MQSISGKFLWQPCKADVVFINDLPRTRNMKVMRRVIRSVFTGQDPGDISSLVNPETVVELQRIVSV